MRVVCTCIHQNTPNPACAKCKGSGLVDQEGFLWADGKIRLEKPPSEEPIIVNVAIIQKINDEEIFAEKISKSRIKRLIPPNIEHTYRHELRRQALDFAIRAADVFMVKPKNGAELLLEAEIIEEWLAVLNEK